MIAALNSLSVDLLIIHDIPKKFSKKFISQNPNINSEDIILSEVPAEVNPDLIRFFHNKITSTIGSSNAFAVVFDPSKCDTAQSKIKEYFDIGARSSFPIDTPEIIRLTQEMAIVLYNVQSAKNPGGMLLFIPCHSGSKYGIAILKVEREEGVRIQKKINNDGQTTFDAQHIKDLMLTQKTKLFKIAFFYLDGDDIVGYVCDKQQGVLNNREVADFFLVDFLGCKLKDEPPVTTKKFFDAVSTFINDCDLSDNDKLNIHTHLISELTNNLPIINSLEFANKYIPHAQIETFMTSLSNNQVPQSFTKDIELITDKITRVRYEFTCGITISGLKSVVNENASFSQVENGKTKMELIDHIKRVESK